MPANLALFLWIIGLIGLFWLDRDPTAKASKALWIPVAWLTLGASRMPSQWLAAFGFGGDSKVSPEQLLEGSPTDRLVISGLVVLSLIVLIARRKKVFSVLRSNAPIVLFFLYCAISILWSDFPEVAFKRWTKDVGDLSMILIVLTDQDPYAAVKRFLARTGFVLISASVLVIKYFPAIGRGYHPWSWDVYYVGVSGGGKNELGLLTLIFAIASVWRLVRIYRGDEGESRARRLIAHGAVLGMALWLFSMANSATSWACFSMATVLIVVTSFRRLERKPLVAQLLVLAMLAVSFSALFLDTGGSLVKSMDRDPTLTGRTEVWKDVLAMTGNPMVGTGFESFWLGARLESMWRRYWWHPNEAHNGYLEVYLTLGWIGEFLLAVVLVTGYRNAVKAYRFDPQTGRLKLAYFAVAVAYNFTESAIRIMHPMWIFLLFASVAAPGVGTTETEPPKSDEEIKVIEPEVQMEPVFRSARDRRAFETLR